MNYEKVKQKNKSKPVMSKYERTKIIELVHSKLLQEVNL